MEQMPIEFNRLQAQQSFTDLNALNDIRQLGQEDQSLALRKVAEQFESMFMSMMLKSMRAANDVFAKDNPLNSSEMNFHRDMYDNQLSLNLSQGGKVGLAEALYRQMESSYIGSNNIDSESVVVDGVTKSFGDGEINAERLVNASPYRESIENIIQRKQDATVLDKIKTPEDFIKAITPYAETIAKTMGVDPKVLVAQAALETGWGEYITKDSQGNHSFNLFNIKADKRWDGHSVKVPTIEYRDGVAQRETASFRRYDSIEDSFKDYEKFLDNPRYEKALEVATNSQEFVKALQSAGYATDPKYADKIQRILKDL